jgi:adenosylcobinamide kinase / adenosylcobinamide-phosphate guanylyltransferase
MSAAKSAGPSAAASAATIVLVTGGGRSGKSSYAQRLAEVLPGPRAYIATATPFDAELQERVAKHQEDRRAGGWSATVEEPVALARALREAPAGATVLVDCLTMWMGNLMWAAEQEAGVAAAAGVAGADGADSGAGSGAAVELTESRVASLCLEVAAAARERGGPTVFVTNEVGLGIIPDNPASRLYRDLLGRCNQVMAGAADTVVLMVSGLPLVLKGRDPFEGAAPASGGGASPGGASAGGGPAPGGASL